MSVHTDISNSTEYLILRVYLEKLMNKYGVGKIEIENIKVIGENEHASYYKS